MSNGASLEVGGRGLAEGRALACFFGALLWAAPRALWPAQAGDDSLSPIGIGGYVALVGCGSFSLALVALAWRPMQRSDGSRSWSAALSLGFGLALLPWAAFALWLSVATHHRPLGAVTFAVAAAASGVVCLLAARWLIERQLQGRRAGVASVRVASGIAVLAAGALVVVLARAAFLEAELRSPLSEGVLGLLIAGLIVALPLARWSATTKRWWLPLCVGVWVVTAGLLRSSADVRATVKSAPTIAGVVGLLLR